MWSGASAKYTHSVYNRQHQTIFTHVAVYVREFTECGVKIIIFGKSFLSGSVFNCVVFNGVNDVYCGWVQNYALIEYFRTWYIMMKCGVGKMEWHSMVFYAQYSVCSAVLARVFSTWCAEKWCILVYTVCDLY